MRRATAAFIGTMAGTALLVGAKYATPTTVGNGSASAPIDAGADGSAASADPGTSVDPSAAGAGAPAASGSAPAAGASAPAGGTKTTAPAGGTKTTAPAAPTTASCKNYTGAAATVASPGVGALTVTIKVCNGAITTSSGTLSQSNWDANAAAIAKCNADTIKYYKTDITKLSYSGATLTKNAYVASVQSAMTKAGLP